MTRRLLLVAALLAFGLAHPPRAQTSEADAAARDLLPYLEAPAVLAATAALIHADTGRYPADPFALLGAPAATATGARRIALAALALSADADTLRARYVLTPTPEDPAERTGGFALYREGGGYAARFRLDRRADPDLRDADLALTTTRTLRVGAARGRLCLDLDRVRALAAEGRLPAQAPFLDPEEAIEVEFVTSAGGRPVASARLTPPGGP